MAAIARTRARIGRVSALRGVLLQALNGNATRQRSKVESVNALDLSLH